MSITTYTAALSTLRTRLETFVALPIAWPNQKFKPESDGGEDGWVYSSVGLLRSETICIGSPGTNTVRDYGELHVHVYVPRGSLSGVAEAHAETIRGLFKTGVLTDIHIESGSILAGDFDGDGLTELGFRSKGGRTYFRDDSTEGPADHDFFFGMKGDEIITGDWNHDGTDTVGIWRASDATFYLSDTNGNVLAVYSFPCAAGEDWIFVSVAFH